MLTETKNKKKSAPTSLLTFRCTPPLGVAVEVAPPQGWQSGVALQAGPRARHGRWLHRLQSLPGKLRGLGRGVLQDLVELLTALPLRQVIEGGVHAALIPALRRLPRRLSGLEGRGGDVQQGLQVTALRSMSSLSHWVDKAGDSFCC